MSTQNTGHHTDLFGTLVAVAKFKTAGQAVDCQMTVTALFKKISSQVKELYAKGDGVAFLKDVSEIYQTYGLTNLTGWEQNLQITVNGNDVIWPLPDGMDPAEAEDLIIHMEPQIIEFHDISDEVEQWQLYPIPQLLSSEDMDFTVSSAEYMPVTPSKKTIH